MRRFAAVGPVAGHKTHIRDLRRLFGDPEQRAAECSCGWIGAAQTGPNAERLAKRDGSEHINHARRTKHPPERVGGHSQW